MYQLISNSYVRIQNGDGTETVFPVDDRNSDYLAYQQWLAEGNTPTPADPIIPVIPSVVTMRQARLALLNAGMLLTVNAAVDAADDATKIAWEYSTEVQRDFPLVQTLAAALNLTEKDLDNLFISASLL